MGSLDCKLKKVTSQGNIFIECNHEMEPGNDVCMELSLPGISIGFLGRIVDCIAKTRKGEKVVNYDVRIDYLNIPQKVMTKIKEFIGQKAEISIQ